MGPDVGREVTLATQIFALKRALFTRDLSTADIHTYFLPQTHIFYAFNQNPLLFYLHTYLHTHILMLHMYVYLTTFCNSFFFFLIVPPDTVAICTRNFCRFLALSFFHFSFSVASNVSPIFGSFCCCVVLPACRNCCDREGN